MTSWGSLEEGIARHDPAKEFRLAFKSAPSVDLGAAHSLPVTEAGDVSAQSLPAGDQSNSPKLS